VLEAAPDQAQEVPTAQEAADLPVQEVPIAQVVEADPAARHPAGAHLQVAQEDPLVPAAEGDLAVPFISKSWLFVTLTLANYEKDHFIGNRISMHYLN
jgi:hypothetical protein